MPVFGCIMPTKCGRDAVCKGSHAMRKARNCVKKFEINNSEIRQCYYAPMI